MELPSAWGYINDAINITKTMQGISLDSLPIYQVAKGIESVLCYMYVLRIRFQVHVIEIFSRNVLVYWRRQSMTLQLQHLFMLN